jgi:hypothetical protein
MMSQNPLLQEAIKEAQAIAHEWIENIVNELMKIQNLPAQDKKKLSSKGVKSFKKWLTDSVNYLIEVWVKAEFRINALEGQSALSEDYPNTIRDFGIEPYTPNEAAFTVDGRLKSWHAKLFLDDLLFLPFSIANYFSAEGQRIIKSYEGSIGYLPNRRYDRKIFNRYHELCLTMKQDDAADKVFQEFKMRLPKNASINGFIRQARKPKNKIRN